MDINISETFSLRKRFLFNNTLENHTSGRCWCTYFKGQLSISDKILTIMHQSLLHLIANSSKTQGKITRKSEEIFNEGVEYFWIETHVIVSEVTPACDHSLSLQGLDHRTVSLTLRLFTVATITRGLPPSDSVSQAWPLLCWWSSKMYLEDYWQHDQREWPYPSHMADLYALCGGHLEVKSMASEFRCWILVLELPPCVWAGHLHSLCFSIHIAKMYVSHGLLWE